MVNNSVRILLAGLMAGAAMPAVSGCDLEIVAFDHPKVKLWAKYRGESDYLEVETEALKTPLCVTGKSPNRMYKVGVSVVDGAKIPAQRKKKLEARSWWVSASGVKTNRSKDVIIHCDEGTSGSSIAGGKSVSVRPSNEEAGI